MISLSVASFSVRRGKVKPENTAAVIGAGMIGLCVTQVLKAMGVSKIIVSGRKDRRLQAARESGVVIDATTEDALQAVMSATDGLGMDVVIECSGNPDSFTQAMAMCRGGGMIVQTALFDQPVTFNPAAFTTKNLTITGIQGEHFPSALELLSSGKVNTKSLITHQFSLNQVKEAFEVLTTTPDAIKVLIKP
ncbi:zinc-binding dehydrogenase [Chloroflexota bacterium]